MSAEVQTATSPAGMGAILGAKGVTFRVWAPHADEVIVTGANDVWVVEGPFGEILLPVIDEVVTGIENHVTRQVATPVAE